MVTGKPLGFLGLLLAYFLVEETISLQVIWSEKDGRVFHFDLFFDVDIGNCEKTWKRHCGFQN